jgi:hypothetical protein
MAQSRLGLFVLVGSGLDDMVAHNFLWRTLVWGQDHRIKHQRSVHIPINYLME